MRIIKIALSALLMLALTVPAFALEVPQLTGRVVDKAGMLSPQVRQKLNSTLAGLEGSDSTQMAVLTVPSLEGESIEGFGIRVAEQWQLGQADKDNGVILIVSEADRKIRLEVGYGLEGVLTDALAGSIIDNEITPRFKAGDFDAGIVAGVTATMQAVKGEYKASPGSGGKGGGGIPLLFVAIIVVFTLSHLFTPRSGSRRAYRRSGGAGGILPWIILGGMMGSGRHHGGGFGGGGGLGGGGFGGFGGGFGGGGASGGW